MRGWQGLREVAEQVELAVGLRAFLPIVAGGDVLAAGETSAGVTHFSLR